MDIELAVVVDELGTAFYSTQGARTDDEKVEMMQLKWVGVSVRASFRISSVVDRGFLFQTNP